MEPIQAEARSAMPCDDISISSIPANFELEVRPFLAHELIGSAVSSTSVELAWTRAEPGREVARRSDSNPTLLIILRGGAELVGRVGRPVRQGDVVTVPPGEEYGFTGVGRDGLHALRVSFREKVGSSAMDVTSLDALRASNELRTQMILNNPFFLLWREGRIESDSKRHMMRECVRILAEVLRPFAPAASYGGDGCCSPVADHPVGEPGNDELRGAMNEPTILADPVLCATSSWFRYQLLTLDEPGTAMVKLVLETARRYLGVLVNLRFHDRDRACSHTYADEDAEQAAAWNRLAGAELSRPDAYLRLHSVLETAWDMFDAMTTRIAVLAAQEMS